MKSAEDIVRPYQTDIKQFGVPDYLSLVITTKEAIKLIDIARNEAILECAEIVNNMAKELEIYLDTKPILDLIQKI